MRYRYTYLVRLSAVVADRSTAKEKGAIVDPLAYPPPLATGADAVRPGQARANFAPCPQHCP